MKRIIYFFLLSWFFVACNDDQELPENLSSNFLFSDCISEKSASTLDHETIEYKYAADDKLLLAHKNVYFNCCQPENNLQADVQLLGDTIVINEFEKEPSVCDCICPYQVDCEVNGLLEKEYWIVYQKGGQESFSFLIDFKEGLEGDRSF